MIKKLRIKFITVSMVSVFIVLLVIMSAINLLNYRQVVQDSDKILSVLSENNGTFPKREGFHKDRGMNDFSAEMPYETRYFSVCLNESGTAVSVDTGRIAAVDTQTAMDYAEELWQSHPTGGFKSYYRYMKTCQDGETTIIFLDCQKSLANVNAFLLYSVVVSAAGIAAVGVLVVLLSKRVIKPVQESYEKQKSFITDAGHEIKTPLTIIDADATILEMECGENEWIDDIRAQIRRLTELTKDLIYLSRMEESDSQLSMIDFPLSDVLTETAQSFQSLAKVQEKQFTVEVQPMLTLCGDEKAIRQITSILLDNALKYSDEHGSISLKAYAKGKNILIEVYNTAESVQTAELDRLFDRFYRAEKSRNSQTGGYGIGLSIAKAVAEAHKGRISAASSDGKSLTITVLLGGQTKNALDR